MPGHKSKIIEVKGGFRYRDFIVGIVVAFAIVIAFEHFRSAHIFSSIPIKIFPATVEIMMEPKAATDEFAIPSRELARDVASESSIFGSSLYAQFRNAFMTRKPNDGKLKNINNYEYNAAQEFTHSSAETTSSMKTSLLGQSINKLLQLMPTSKESSLNDTNGDSAASTVRSLTKPYCKAKYGTKRFLKASEKRKPPMLYTFPGK